MDQLSAIQHKLQPELSLMNQIIRDTLFTDNELMNKVVEYFLREKGKQIRPIMVILSAGFFNGVNQTVIHAGAALEMLHNASLIHDDIVDETSLRRGRPTVNMEWGDHVAVLVGDYFVSNALSTAIKTGNIEIISALSSLGKELSLGEIDQICNARDHHFDEQSYIDMIRQKTASLFVNCVKMGAEASGASPDEYLPMLRFAELLGLAFQIKDDVFDYFDSTAIGKPTGNDLREGKVTLPLIHALEKAPQDESDEMKAILVRGDLSDAEIEKLLTFAKSNNGVEYAFGKMHQMQREADAILENYPHSTWSDSLRDIFAYIISRNK